MFVQHFAARDLLGGGKGGYMGKSFKPNFYGQSSFAEAWASSTAWVFLGSFHRQYY